MPRKERAQRSALSFGPSLGEIVDGRDAYVTLNQLRALVVDANRWWTFHRMPTTVELPNVSFPKHTSGPRYAKLWDRFTDHSDKDAFLELLREYRELGVARPGGYADVFHKRYKTPHVAWSVNAMLAPAFAGGWQDALRVGVHSGTYYKYDMRSAYLWAGSQGMPDPKTYRRTLEYSATRPGVYRIELVAPERSAPFPFNRAKECLASSEEIETYGLQIKSVITGVTWTRTIDPENMLSNVRAVSTWKQAARSYWGRWGQTARVECHAGGKTWNLPNIAANIPWAHLIVSRVKLKLWHAVDASTVHVYVDSLLTQKPIVTGDGIGDWKLEQTYTNGLIVRGTGQYGDASAARLERMAGAPKNSPLRDIMANRYLEELLTD